MTDDTSESEKNKREEELKKKREELKRLEQKAGIVSDLGNLIRALFS